MPEEVKWVVIAVVIVMALGFGGIAYDDYQSQQQMEACVAAGKDWVRDFGSYYECVDK